MSVSASPFWRRMRSSRSANERAIGSLSPPRARILYSIAASTSAAFSSGDPRRVLEAAEVLAVDGVDRQAAPKPLDRNRLLDERVSMRAVLADVEIAVPIVEPRAAPPKRAHPGQPRDRPPHRRRRHLPQRPSHDPPRRGAADRAERLCLRLWGMLSARTARLARVWWPDSQKLTAAAKRTCCRWLRSWPAFDLSAAGRGRAWRW